MNDNFEENIHFITVSKAAKRFGVSSLRLRLAAAQNLIPSKRDNEGQLRLDINQIQSSDFLETKVDLKAIEVFDLIFDEVEELQVQLKKTEQENSKLKELAFKQSEVIDRAEAKLSNEYLAKKKVFSLLEKAIHLLEENALTDRQKENLSQRALNLCQLATEKFEKSNLLSKTFQSMLERALTAAEEKSKDYRNNLVVLSGTTDKAMDTLETAIERAELEKSNAEKSNVLLDKALLVGEKLEAKLKEKEQNLKKNQTSLEQALAISERAVNLSENKPLKKKKPSFLRFLLGV